MTNACIPLVTSVDDFKDKIIRFINCFILRQEQLVLDQLWICNGVILDELDLFFTGKIQEDIRIDLHGSVISPGFIDIQVNGAFGFDFSNTHQNVAQSCDVIASKLVMTGVTAFCPTIITSSKQVYCQLLPQFRAYREKPGYAQLLGVHLEGPFISKLHSGMHPKSQISDFGSDPVQTLLDTYGSDLDVVRMVTLAPELPGSDLVIAELASRGIIVSIGHTDANCTALENAVAAGATFMTHLFNAMPMFHHRRSHLFGSVTYPNPELFVGIIADLVHVHAAGLRVAEAIAPGRVVLVTDSNMASGLPDGDYTFGEQEIEVRRGVAFIAGTTCLAGSTTFLPDCICNFWREVCQCFLKPSDMTGNPWPGLGKALAAASTRPARGLRLYQQGDSATGPPKLRKGSLEPGADADFVILCPKALSHPVSPKVKVISTWIRGVPAFQSPECNFTLSNSRQSV